MHRERGGPFRWLAPIIFVAGAATSAAYLCWRFERYVVEGRSMMPTLQDGDWVLIDRRAYKAEPRPGDVVVAHDPRDSARLIFKRVNHVDLHKRAWLLGDNVAESTDSRVFGGVTADAVGGKVVWRYWPLAHFGPVR